MHKNTLLSQALVGVCALAILILIVLQARVAFQPHLEVSFHRPPIAYGYPFRNVIITGRVYDDEGVTPLAGRIVAATFDGGVIRGTGATTATGYYAIYNLSHSGGGVVVETFLLNQSERAATVTTLSGGSLHEFDLYKNRLIVRSDSGSAALTNAHLATGDNSATADSRATADLLSVFHVDGSTIAGLGTGKELFVRATDTFQPGARVKTHDLDVRGTMTLGSNGLVASGSVTVSGTLTTSTGILLTSVDREVLAMTGVALQNITIDNGLWGYWKMDEGTGSVIRDSSRFRYTGTTSGIDVGTANTGWIRGSTGTALFYNPRALQLDGTADFVNIGDVIDVADVQDFTITGWFNRSSFAADHTILAKKASQAAGTAGYILWIDDSTDALHFAISDGSDQYTLQSSSTFTGAGWKHFAVVWDQNSAAATEIYVSGTADSATDSGTIGSVNDTSNTQDLRLGAESDGDSSFHGVLDDLRIYRRVLDSSEIRALAQGNKATGSGTYALGAALNVDGNLGIFAGGLDISAASKNINAAGNWENQGGFVAGSGNVILDGGTQTMSGSTFFKAFKKVVSASFTLFFDFTSRQSVSGALVLRGADASTQMLIRSTKSGSTARLVLDAEAGTQTLEYLGVRDNRASSGVTLACATGCTDSKNNFNWSFVCGDGVVSQTEACDDGDTTSGDGCSSSCTVESGYSCSGEASTCVTDCGDEIVAGDEDCDEGDDNSNAANAACRTDCTEQRCGDAVVDTGEACDDGNSSNTDNCLDSCVLPTCGDGHVREGFEQCEPPNNGACQANCYLAGGGGGGKKHSSAQAQSYSSRKPPPAGCGNNILEKDKGEECDEGRFNDLGSCSFYCKIHYCGDGIVSTGIGEECEPKRIVGKDAKIYFEEPPLCGAGCTVPNALGKEGCVVRTLPACSVSSARGIQQFSSAFTGPVTASSSSTSAPSPVERAPICGNGALEGSEACDDNNRNDGDGCSAQCAYEFAEENDCGGQGQPSCAPSEVLALMLCGNGTIELDEECDDGDGNSSALPGHCRNDCRLPYCGDRVTDAGEECDSGIGCLPECKRSIAEFVCGDGQRESYEECDDSNALDGDGCSGSCKREVGSSPVLLARPLFILDADVVLVNPTEIAVALKYLSHHDPCAVLTAKGESLDAADIRDAAKRQSIPIVRHIELTHAIYDEVALGGYVLNPQCVELNALRFPRESAGQALEPIPETLPEPITLPSVEIPVSGPMVDLPFAPLPTAAIIPDIPAHAPVGDTGPGAILLVALGSAGAVGWLRRRRRTTEG